MATVGVKRLMMLYRPKHAAAMFFNAMSGCVHISYGGWTPQSLSSRTCSRPDNTVDATLHLF